MSLFGDDRAVLDDFRAGKESVLRGIYEKYVKDVELFISSGWFNPKTRSRAPGIKSFELQAELIQEVFMRAFSDKARLSYDGVRPYRAFLLRIARNVIVDYVRKQARDAISHICLELDDGDLDSDRLAKLDHLSLESDATEDALHWKRCVSETAVYVTTLDNTQKKFVQLRFQEEMSLLEVARRLRLTRGKARFLEKQLARRLKRYLSRKNLLTR